MNKTKNNYSSRLKRINIIKFEELSPYEQSIKASKVFNDPIIKKLIKKSEELKRLELDPDHKFYADLIPKTSSRITKHLELAKINILCSKNAQQKRISRYIGQHFDLPNNELIKLEIPKTKIYYRILKKELSNSKLLKERTKDYAKATKYINENWNNLYRRTPATTESSLIPLPKPFIVPGGRFREIYYWDSFFTILGLNRSNLATISEDMAENFLHLIDTYGFIPNGNRTYYLSRSQPPMFAMMVNELKENKSKQWLEKYYNGVAKEYSFWMRPDERYIADIGLNRYYDSKDTARIEAFGEDNKNLKIIPSRFYQNERAICESGLDFSRKYSDGPLNIIPIELNSLLYKYEVLLSSWANELGKKQESIEWKQKAKTRKENMFKYLYDEKAGIFKDYNFKKQKHTNTDNLMMLFPLWVELLAKHNAKEVKISKKIRNYIVKNFEKAHGLTLLKEDAVVDKDALIQKEDNEYQWDSPNGWAPLQYIATSGLENYGFTDDAERIMKKWLDINTDLFKQEGKFYEKYNVLAKNEHARTCYPEQDGFGWTNGVYLEFLYKLKSK